MTLGATESRGEKCFDQFPGERLADHKTSQADHVQVVVLNPLPRGESFMDQAHARTPGTLLAATHAPTPLPQMATPRSTSPQATARAKGTTKSG